MAATRHPRIEVADKAVAPIFREDVLKRTRSSAIASSKSARISCRIDQ
jgi:hypothetical protein